ncbi:bifunctional riboflavin kinase/FAD synthetase [Ponticaulis profundi]|uniref:Riboflavin biosynthesis protein n=1 Tax=Ponticaulis profundi TaxID=2665222 RepID=A0ABW1S6E4_9PROT
MSIIFDYKNVPEAQRGASVALGNFDGVHAGHRAVIDLAKQVSDARGVPLAALIFEPPPRRYFQPDSPPFRIMRPEQRREALKTIGVDIVYELPFNKELASMSPRAFVEQVLVKGLGLAHLAVGFDFRFGKGREGDTDTLRQLGEEFGFTVSVMDAVKADSEKISSTAIRTYLQEGQPEHAAHLLGHYWTADGVVEQGEQRGRTISFPTANLRIGNLIQPMFGVYAVWAKVEGDDVWRPGVANFGRTPTTGEREPLLEVHFFDFDQDIYGKHLDVAFVHFLRAEKKFDSFEALTTQIATDASDARERLGSAPQKELPAVIADFL